jgi:hypothetical protein
MEQEWHLVPISLTRTSIVVDNMAPRRHKFNHNTQTAPFPLRTFAALFLCLTILLSGMMIGNQVAQASSFESPLNVSMNDGLVWQFTLADAHENVYLAWQDQTSGIDSIFFSRSNNRGASFSEPVNMSIDNDRPAFSHDMVASGDRVFVVWSQLPGPFNVTSDDEEQSFPFQTLYLRKSTDNGDSFGDPVAVSPPGLDARNPKVAVSGRNIYVGWEGWVPEGETSRIFLTRSTDGGKTFSDPVDFDGSTNVRVAAYQNNVYLTWDEGFGNLMFASSTDYGESFEEPVNLSNKPGYSAWSRLLLAPRTGDIYIAWLGVGNASSDVIFTRSLDGGNTFEPSINVSNNEWNNGIPSMALHGNNLYLVWSDEIAFNHEVFISRSRDGGASFETPVNISMDRETSWEAVVSAYREKVFVAWVNENNGGFDTFVAESNNWGGKFSRGINLSNNVGDSMFMGSAISRGHYYLGWTDDSTENFDLFFARTIHDSAPNVPPAFPTIDRSEVEEITKDAITPDVYGLKMGLVFNEEGYGFGLTPVDPNGEGPEPDPIAITMSSETAVWHHHAILCGPDNLCIEDSQGGGLISGGEEFPSLLQFYPLNEVSWKLGDSVTVWVLISKIGADHHPEDEFQWVSIGEQTIEQCDSELWC